MKCIYIYIGEHVQILKFLRCEPFCCGDGEKLWKSLIQSPMDAGIKRRGAISSSISSSRSISNNGNADERKEDIGSEFVSASLEEDAALVEADDRIADVLWSNFQVDRARNVMHELLQKVII